MRRVLIVSPRFPPTSAPELHRIRVSLTHYRSFGWEPTVLCIDPGTADSVHEPVLVESVPKTVPVVRVNAWNEKKCRRFGFGHLAIRGLVPLYRAGRKLLREERYDLVFFSTTLFLTFVLAPLWKRKYGCHIVYDFQDPWYAEVPYTRDTAPGRWWKYRLDRFLSRFLEHFAMGAADHVISVSEGYVASLTRRYHWLSPSKFTVLPFGGAESDYDLVSNYKIKPRVFCAGDGLMHWVYAGRGGSDMTPILSVLFAALTNLRQVDPEFAALLRVHFVGTNYAPRERSYKLIEPLARAYGLEGLVEEVSERVPYLDAISLYHASDAILLIGSMDPDYTASKFIPCVLSRKPILALLHHRSPVSRTAAQFPNVFLATFGGSPEEPAFEAEVAKGLEWLRAPKFDLAAIDSLLAPWSPKELTRRQCTVFDSVVSSTAPFCKPSLGVAKEISS